MSDAPVLAAPKRRILAIANQKGGVGKTTTAINLATALAAVGEKVVLVDLDPQGNASTGLGIDRAARSRHIYDVLTGEIDLDQAALPTAVPNLFIVPSTTDLTSAEIELASLPNRNHRLQVAFRTAAASYQHILIDCPPSLGLLTLNALVAADAVLVPLQCEFFALEGLSLLLKTIEGVRAALNPALAVQGVVLTMYDQRNKLTDQVAQDVRQHLGEVVYDTVIPRNVRVSEAPSHGKPALIYDPHCAGTEAYIKLAREMLRRERRVDAA